MSAADITLREPGRFAFDLVTVAGAVLLAAGAFLVAGGQSEASTVVVALVASGGLLLARRPAGFTVAGLVLPYLALPSLIGIIRATAGAVPISVWLALAACWFAAVAGVSYLSAIRRLSRTNGRIRDLAVAALFGLWLMILWEALIVGFKVPFILLPPPSAVWLKLMNSIPTLAADFPPYIQTGPYMLLTRIVALIEAERLQADGDPWDLQSCRIRLPA